MSLSLCSVHVRRMQILVWRYAQRVKESVGCSALLLCLIPLQKTLIMNLEIYCGPVHANDPPETFPLSTRLQALLSSQTFDEDDTDVYLTPSFGPSSTLYLPKFLCSPQHYILKYHSQCFVKRKQYFVSFPKCV